MPKLKDKDIEINYDQICDLVRQLAFEKRMALIRDVAKEINYREDFYAYTENLTQKYSITEMNEDELDVFLHDKN